MNQRRQRFLAMLAATGIFALPALGWGQEADVLRIRVADPNAKQQRFFTLVNQEAEATESEETTGRWLGVQVTELPPVLQKHLQLKHGVLAEDILPDTPAAKAGIEQFDVLLSIEGENITLPEDVREAVQNAKEGEPLSIELLHNGKQMTLKIVPAPRPTIRATETQEDPHAIASGAAASQEEFLKHQHQAMKAIERALAGRQAANMMFMRPGIVAERLELPKDVTVSITRRGPQPAKIHVERGEESWDVNEKTLDKLPQELQAPVAAMVQGPMPFSIKLPANGDQSIRFAPQVVLEGDVKIQETPQESPEPKPDPSENQVQMRQVLKEIRSLKKQLDAMQHQLQKQD
jgi:membrane-associated protease RseP (regulator of RpoE activity)